MRFEDAYEGWTENGLTQIDAARLLGVCPLGRLGDHRNRHQGWNVKHYTAWYKREGGSRSYTWVKNTLSHQANRDQPSSPAGTGASWTMCSANILNERCAKITVYSLGADPANPCGPTPLP